MRRWASSLVKGLLLLWIAGTMSCAVDPPIEGLEPTMDIEATIETRLAEERAMGATIEARVSEELSARTAVEPSLTPTSAPTLQLPIATLIPTPTATPVPTAIPVPTATPVPAATPPPKPVHDIKLDNLREIAMGPVLRVYDSNGRKTSFSKLVSPQLVWQMHQQLDETAEQLEVILGVQINHFPDLYLLHDSSTFNQVRDFLRVLPGEYEPSGFYGHSCTYSGPCHVGIYLNAGDSFSEIDLYSRLTHEYTHSLVREITDGKSDVIPAWVDEGIAVWAEFEIIEDNYKKKDARTGAAIGAVLFGGYIPLSELEDNKAWKLRSGPQVSLQYSEAYMAIRFLVEKYGSDTVLKLIEDLNQRGSLNLAIQKLTGITYQEFEKNFIAWLKEF